MINSVRNTVLTILNKNNYGYISPSDFNLLAQNAQMELYEEYYSNYNKTVNAENVRTSGTEYADVKKPIAEVLEQFLVSDFLVPRQTASGIDINNFYVPSLTTTGNLSFMLNKIIVYTKKLASGVTDNTIPFGLEDSTADFIASGVAVGDIVVNATTFKSSIVQTVVSTTVLGLYDDIFQDPASFEDYFIYSSKKYAEADKVSNVNISLLNNSLLTAPSLLYPSYSLNGEVVSIFPSSIVNYGAIKCDYFRYPKVPKWTYSLLASGEPVFNQSQPDYQDFELPTEDEYKLVTKILEYCGIVIREIEVSQFGSAQQQHEQPTFSMQQ
jgi:hypothetical protein